MPVVGGQTLNWNVSRDCGVFLIQDIENPACSQQPAQADLSLSRGVSSYGPKSSLPTSIIL